MKKQILLTYLIIGLSFIISFKAQAQSKVKVACVGNSITEGYGLKTTYPMALQKLMGDKFEVRNYGVGGRTLLKKGDYPYWKEDKYQQVLGWNPDIVIIKLGTNDSKPQNWKYKEEYVQDYIAFINSFKSLPSKPQIYICYPIPVFEDKWGINEIVVKGEVLPMVKTVAKKAKVKTIDLYTPFIGKADLTYDAIHPNDTGAELIANEIYKVLKANKALALAK